MACACIMACATVLVIRECIAVLVDGLAHGEEGDPSFAAVGVGGEGYPKVPQRERVCLNDRGKKRRKSARSEGGRCAIRHHRSLCAREASAVVILQATEGCLTGDAGVGRFVDRGLVPAEGHMKSLSLLNCRFLSTNSPSFPPHLGPILAEDHWNDVLSNLGAIVWPTIAFYVPTVWWLDAAGGIGISLYILYSWYMITIEQVGWVTP